MNETETDLACWDFKMWWFLQRWAQYQYYKVWLLSVGFACFAIGFIFLTREHFYISIWIRFPLFSKFSAQVSICITILLISVLISAMFFIEVCLHGCGTFCSPAPIDFGGNSLQRRLAEIICIIKSIHSLMKNSCPCSVCMKTSETKLSERGNSVERDHPKYRTKPSIIPLLFLYSRTCIHTPTSRKKKKYHGY